MPRRVPPPGPESPGLAPPGPESLFHPAVASWFARRFPDGPTPPQASAWPHIAAGRDVLVASPTGSGKTLTGFLVAIDAAYRAAAQGARTGGVSPVRTATRRPGSGQPSRAASSRISERGTWRFSCTSTASARSGET